MQKNPFPLFRGPSSERRRTIARAISALALVFGSAISCANTTSTREQPPSDEELAQIEAEIGRLNTCEDVQDCVPVMYYECRTAWIGRSADRRKLDRQIADYGAEYQLCPSVCALATLRCNEGRCVTTSGRCDFVGDSTPPADARCVCE